MSAMHADVTSMMIYNLQVKFTLMQRLIPFHMTHEECIRLVAPSEHIPILTSAAKYADISSCEAWIGVHVPATMDGEMAVAVNLMMRTHADKEPPLRPREPSWQKFETSAQYEAGNRVIEWGSKFLELARRFGTASYVINWLDANCENGAQIRYLMPSIMHLAKGQEGSRVQKWAEKHAAYKPVKFAPALSPQLKRAIQDTSALLTSAMLIGDEVPEPPLGEVMIAMHVRPRFTMSDGLRVERM